MRWKTPFKDILPRTAKRRKKSATPRTSAPLTILSFFYLATTLLFVVAKPCFVWAQSASVREGVSTADLLQVMWHGLALDLATAGYASAPLWLLLGIAIWLPKTHVRYIYKVYALLVALVFGCVVVADACLYGFWGTKLDSTAWGYLDSPTGALQSVTGWFLCGVMLAVSVTVFLAARLLLWAVNRRLKPVRHRLALSGVWLLVGGLIFLGIRGGVGKSTANVGMVYFSDRLFLNHAAVNPAFSLLSSLKKAKAAEQRMDFFPADTCAALFAALDYNTRSENTERLLHTTRPNVLIVLMEGCGGQFVHAVDPKSDPNVTPNLNRLAHEGIVFTECYANSYRTDRGTVCTFSGYPSFPNLSVMKLAAKASKLPSIAGALREAGYDTEFLYGGDINFTNTNGYLLSTGYRRTTGDTGFPPEARHTHDWGVTDAIAFDSLFQRIIRRPQQEPWHIGFLTLASHEPWKVPYSRLPHDEKANAFAYLDDCIGRFVEKLKKTEAWKNLLVIFLPDHGINYPEGIPDSDERRSHIPMIWVGGAVSAPRVVSKICNQTDLPATLLGQMDLPHDAFRFSRDVMSDTYRNPCAVHTWNEGVYFKDSTGISVVNLLTKPASIIREAPTPSPRRCDAAKAFLQTCYDDLRGL